MTDQKKPRGFACLPPDERAKISSMGGRAVPADRRNFSLDRESASRAGTKGGSMSRKRAVTDREGGI
jgi:general stress protein YciG